MTAETLVRRSLCVLCVLLLQLSAYVYPSHMLAADNPSLNETIARLNHAGFKHRAHCSAFSIEGRGLVTAAHCLPDIETDTVHILFAYNKGTFSQHLRVSGQSFRQVADKDIAVLCEGTGKQPGLPLSKSGPVSGLAISVKGYGAPKVHVQQSNRCFVRAVSDHGTGTLDCPLPPGTSGAPVIATEDGGVIGVVSASGRNTSLFTSIDAGILDQVCG